MSWKCCRIKTRKHGLGRSWKVSGCLCAHSSLGHALTHSIIIIMPGIWGNVPHTCASFCPLNAELLVRRIIIFVLIMVLLLPCFEAQYGVWGKYEGE